MQFDLNKLDTARCADEGIVYNIRHPETNEVLPLTVKIKGADSEAFQRVSDASLNEVFKQIAKTGKVNRTAVDTREERIASVTAMITEWDGFSRDGNVLECTEENKSAIFGHRGFGWMLDQVDAQIRDRANFLPK
jgi:hypothetical protein